MSTDSPETPRPLPDRPNLRHLKDQAKDLLKTGVAATLTAAQFQIARLHGRFELEPPEQHPEPLRSADFSMGVTANAFGLLPAPEQRVHEGGQLHVRGEGPERGVQVAGGAADGTPVDVDLR